MLPVWRSLQTWARQLKQQVLVLYCALRLPQTPLPLKISAALVVMYALSPIDFIPDFIPILGYLDDLILVPLGVWFVLRFLPQSVRLAAIEAAQALSERPAHWRRYGLVFMLLLWLLTVWLGLHCLGWL